MFYKQKQNLHTHTCYCDGLDKPEEIISEAINKGFSSIGFSGHSYMHYSPSHSISLEGTEEYKKEIKCLKEKYKGKFDVFCGLEVDMYSQVDLSGYDYLIGSVHYLKMGKEYVGFDRGEKEVEEVIDNYFNGNGMEYAKEYYRQLALLPEYGDFDIIAHFDIITKHSDNRSFFDETSKEYINAALSAAHSLAGKIPLFEVNTGAIARGYRKTPYPSEQIVKELKRLGFGVVVTSDCHDKRFLDCKRNEAIEFLKYCGFKEQYVLTNSGFCAVPL